MLEKVGVEVEGVSAICVWAMCICVCVYARRVAYVESVWRCCCCNSTESFHSVTVPFKSHYWLCIDAARAE